MAATIVLVIVELVLIGIVLLQSGKTSGLSGTIAGGAESFFGKNKARSFEAKLNKLTKYVAAAFIILAVVVAFLQR
ncbi:MAG TPA: preprotein translocase subunit SecG [Clostridiales bacterium]|nr:preprotein translocase subunit SecG [Clostridiales bacterium]